LVTEPIVFKSKLTLLFFVEKKIKKLAMKWKYPEDVFWYLHLIFLTPLPIWFRVTMSEEVIDTVTPIRCATRYGDKTPLNNSNYL
jgi:hypothetical protein